MSKETQSLEERVASLETRFAALENQSRGYDVDLLAYQLAQRIADKMRAEAVLPTSFTVDDSCIAVFKPTIQAPS